MGINCPENRTEPGRKTTEEMDRIFFFFFFCLYFFNFFGGRAERSNELHRIFLEETVWVIK